ncbi:hypothetical protein JCM10207_007018 [Rhodosporidiobolus poonsookiae]
MSSHLAERPQPGPDAPVAPSATSLDSPAQTTPISTSAAAESVPTASDPTATTDALVTAPSASTASTPPLSKSALKRQRKAEAMQAQKVARRAHEKEKRKAKTAEVRRLVAEGLMERPAPSKRKKVAGKQAPHGARIVVDMGFDDLMTDKEIKSMVSQLAYCYSANRSAPKPFPLLISSFNGRVRESFEKRGDHVSWKGVEWWEDGFEGLYEAGEAGGADPSEAEHGASTTPTSASSASANLPQPLATELQPADAETAAPSSSTADPAAPTDNSALVQIGVYAGQPRSSCPKTSVIYLTGDSPNILATLEEGKTYILGGIVDRNRHKRLCLDKADRLGIAHAQLPIGEFLPEMHTRKVLTVNQVYEILINYAAAETEAVDGEAQGSNGWREALRKVMPERKFDPDARKKRKEAKKGGDGDGDLYVAQEDDDSDGMMIEALREGQEAQRATQRVEGGAEVTGVPTGVDASAEQ